MKQAQLLKQIQNKQKELEELSQQLSACTQTSKRWRAQKGSNYMSVIHCGCICQSDVRGCIEDYCYDTGNYFETQEEAERYQENLINKQKLKDLALKLNKGVKLDWNNPLQEKWSIHFDFSKNMLQTSYTTGIMNIGEIYCLDSNFRTHAIKLIGRENLVQLMIDGI